MEHNGIALEEALVAVLEAVEGLKGRVCPVVDIQKSTGPLVVYDQREENGQQTLTGQTGLMTAGFQIHVLHGTYFKMRQLAERVKKKIYSLCGYNTAPLLVEAVTVELALPDIMETKVSMFRRTYNVTFQYQIKEE